MAELAADFYEHRDDLAGDEVPSEKPARLDVIFGWPRALECTKIAQLALVGELGHATR